MQPLQMCSSYWHQYKQLVQQGHVHANVETRHGCMDGWWMDGKMDIGSYIVHSTMSPHVQQGPDCLIENTRMIPDGPVWFSGWCSVMSLGGNMSWMDGSTPANDITLPNCTLIEKSKWGDAEKTGIKKTTRWLHVLNEKSKLTHSLRVTNPKWRRWDRWGNTLAGVPNKTLPCKPLLRIMNQVNECVCSAMACSLALLCETTPHAIGNDYSIS